MCLFFVKAAGSAQFGPNAFSPFLQGQSRSAASSLDYTLSKQPLWLLDMFGVDVKGNSLVRRCIKRSNPERKRPGPVRLSLNEHTLSGEQISIFVDNALVLDLSDYKALESKLEEFWYKPQITVASRDKIAQAERPNDFGSFLCAILEREISLSLQRTNIFSDLRSEQAVQAIIDNPSFTKRIPARISVRHLADTNLSHAERFGLGSAPTSNNGSLLGDNPIRCAVPFIFPGATALFHFLSISRGYEFEVNYDFPYAQQLVRSIVHGRFANLPDILVLSLAPAANLLRHPKNSGYKPVMLLPNLSHRVVAPSSKRKGKAVLGKGSYLFLQEEPSTAEFYFEHLERTGVVNRNQVSLSHKEPYEIPLSLADGDPDTRAVTFFPYYDLYRSCLNCTFLDSEKGHESEVILFVSESLSRDQRRIRALDIALRNARISLCENQSEIRRTAQSMALDNRYQTLLRRAAGLHYANAA